MLHRFLKIKKQLLGQETLRYEDIHAPVVKSINRKYSFSEAEMLIKSSQKPLGNDYSESLNKAFADHWMDIYPNKGKTSNAHMINVYSDHPFILLDYNGSFGSVATITHELGHGLNSYFAVKKQPKAMAEYPIFLAEIPSAFNENLLIEFLLKSEKDDQSKLYLLDWCLESVMGSVFDNTLLAEFELTMHKHIESGQPLTAEWLDQTYLALVRQYYGQQQGICEVGDYIQNEWIGIPHLLFNYCIYQYSIGRIASLALSDMVLQEGPRGAKRYMVFQSAGGSDYPLETLRKAGVDLSHPDAANAAFSRVNSILIEMEKLIVRNNNQNF